MKLGKGIIGLFFIVSALAPGEINPTPIREAETFVFDVRCQTVSDREGYLQVELQGEKAAEHFFVRGTFYSYSEDAPPGTKWHLIPLELCQRVAGDLAEKIGRPLSLSGQQSFKPYDAYVDVWGKCHEHPLAGGGTYPCKKGVKKITKYERKVVLDIDGTLILNLSR